MEILKIQVPEGFQIDSFDKSTGEIKFAPKPKDIKERIKHFDDVLLYHGINSDVFKKECSFLTDDEIAYRQLRLIVSALNEDFPPDWQNNNQWKYFPWFDMDDSSSSGRFSFYGSDYQSSDSFCGSRLCFKSRELCDYAATTFIEIYRKFFTI
ncbi:hypothetical protein A0O34_14960 [Chryseobacterium glaciei]|uniref:Uncharacterized protein n=1 Tax=Chryseobacterium glaciei TaxID=1685010 RepID=A0A172XXI5_9FLAO|nr:hypothetical protein [Chryseobacterium glaciei]ANF51723.1 hypothetical protein A0O34_14960 [Chryseobacterium glaciei]